MEPTRRKPLTYILVAGALVLTAWAASAAVMTKPTTLTTVDPTPPNQNPTPPNVTIPAVRPRVELVFALDTTGSMTGLIDGAKRKIWSIAQFVASGQPKPDVRIGLVAYRDIGDAYVTRFYDLSDDLDTVFEHLSSFQADGGGDTPEHVSKALYDAIYRTSWSLDQNTLKQVYLVGDAPPHVDYHDGYDYHAIARHAHDLGIHINAIRCGNDPETQVAWRQIANTSAGEYASIDQSGGVMAVATPYDDKLASLNARLVDTAIGYGPGAGIVRAKVAASHSMAKEEAADRASFFGMAGKGAVGSGDEDLLNAVKSGHVDVAAAPAAALPVEMQALDGDGRKAYVAHKAAERERIQAEINTLAKERNDFLKTKTKAAPDNFDLSVEKAVKKQAASVGLAY